MLLAVIVATGCSSQTAPPQQPPEPASTTTATQPVDAATTELADKATITQADIGDRWTVHTEAKAAEGFGDGSCAEGTVADALPLDARRTGAVFQAENATWYVGSNAAVFPDEATATEWVETRKSAPYVECLRAEFEQGQKEADPRFTVALASTTTEGVGTQGFEAYALYQVMADVGSGPQNANGTIARHTYRVGRTVISLAIDIATNPNDPPDLQQVVSTDVHRALSAVYARLS